MFEYNGYCIVVYGFKKIEYLDENKIIFKYKKRKLFVNGKCLKALNFMDKSLEIRGMIEDIKIEYLGDSND